MRLTDDGRFERNDIWREGKWLDLWSVVHFCTGVTSAIGVSVLGFDTGTAILMAFPGFVAYEFWEAKVKIHETPQNRVMDVVVGMVSFVPTLLFVRPLFTRWELFFVFWAVLALTIVLARIGWHASRKAEELENKMRFEIQRQREKFMHRRELFRARRKRRRLLKSQRALMSAREPRL